VIGLLIFADGAVRAVESAAADDWPFAQVYDLLGCQSVEPVYPPPSHAGGPHLRMWLDEDGKLKGRALNKAATALMAERLRPGDFIVGPVLVTGCDPDSGHPRSLDLLELLRIAERLVRQERRALRPAPGPDSGQ